MIDFIDFGNTIKDVFYNDTLTIYEVLDVQDYAGTTKPDCVAIYTDKCNCQPISNTVDKEIETQSPNLTHKITTTIDVAVTLSLNKNYKIKVDRIGSMLHDITNILPYHSHTELTISYTEGL